MAQAGNFKSLEEQVLRQSMQSDKSNNPLNASVLADAIAEAMMARNNNT